MRRLIFCTVLLLLVLAPHLFSERADVNFCKGIAYLLIEDEALACEISQFFLPGEIQSDPGERV